MNKDIILPYLEMISNEQIIINMINHVIVLLTVVYILVKRKNIPKAVLLLPIGELIISLLGYALVNGNPFHLISFGVFLGMYIFSYKKNEGILVYENSVFNIIAWIIIISGLWYPEFVHINIVQSFIFSPLGVVPCATLLVTMGLLTIFQKQLYKPFCFTCFGLVMIYAGIGVLVLKVWYDILLLVIGNNFIFKYIITKRQIRTCI